jgi:hypothetical protein
MLRCFLSKSCADTNKLRLQFCKQRFSFVSDALPCTCSIMLPIILTLLMCCLQYGGSEAHAAFFQKKRGEWDATTQSRDLMTSIR